MKEGTKEAISLDEREYDISIIENREGEFVMIRQREEGDAKGGIIIPKGAFKEFVEFQKMLPVEKIEKLLYLFMHSNFRQAFYRGQRSWV